MSATLVVLAAASAALAAALLPPPSPAGGGLDARAPAVPVSADEGWLRRYRVWWSLLAAVAGATFVGGPAGLPAALAGALAVWVLAGRAEPAGSRRRREQVARDLPHVVRLLGAALRSGAAPAAAVEAVSAALPGPAADRLGAASARLALGIDPATVWSAMADEPGLAPLGRALARAQASGTSVTTTVERLADDLARAARADVEDRARAVGVRAAIPLGLCLLPAFVLLGIVPLVAGLAGSLAL